MTLVALKGDRTAGTPAAFKCNCLIERDKLAASRSLASVSSRVRIHYSPNEITFSDDDNDNENDEYYTDLERNIA